MRILWVPHTGWHIPQRAHLFCKALAERHEVHVTDWVADFTSLADYFSRRYLRNFTYRRYHDGKIHVHGVPRFSPALPIKALRRLNTVIFSRLVDYLLKQYRIDVVVGTFLLPFPKAPRVVFDLFDDNVAYWRSYGIVPNYADEIEQTEVEYLQKADAIVAASPILMDKALGINPSGSVHLIPNGVDMTELKKANPSGVRHQLNIQGPIVGAVGNHDKKIEMDKILHAAKHFADRHITFLVAGRGKAVPEAQKQADQEGLKNVHFTGYLPFHDAMNMISALDVGLCPYPKTPGADASSPMRLIMYSAMGLPTVCTNLESVRRMNWPNVVLVEDSAHSMAEGIHEALQMPRLRPSQIDEFDLTYLTQKYEKLLLQ